MTDKIVVRMDTINIMPRSLTPFIREDINIGATWAQAQIRDGVWCDPYSGLLMITPLQYLPDPHLSTAIVRHPKSVWVVKATGAAIGSHWDERIYEQEKWLISDGTAEEIETTAVFGKNSAFHVQFAVCGGSGDTFPAVDMWFGQWRLRVQSDGGTFLSRNADSVEVEAVRGTISGSVNENITNKIVDLFIMPTRRGDLYIRRNGVAGFWYRMPANQITDQSVINAGSFRIKPLTGKITFQMTQLRWPGVIGDYNYVSPNFQFGRAPLSTQLISVDVDVDIPSSGGYSTALRKPLNPGGAWADLVDFVYDGIESKYCVSMFFAGSTDHNSSPMLFGMTLSTDPGAPEAITDPSDITYDMVSLTMRTGDTVLDTEASIVIRNPANHLLDGACNRLCTVTTDALIPMTIFVGVMKDPPRYSGQSEGGVALYTVDIASLAKYLNEPCLYGLMAFDGKSHVDSIKTLCYAGGLFETDIEGDADTTLLPPPKASSDGKLDYQFATAYGDSPFQWIESIADSMGWRFTDGYLLTGAFGFKYIDPYAMDDTVIKAYFVLNSDDETGEYQRIYNWDCYSLEPEGNEFVIYGKNGLGQYIAGRYQDAASQDPAIPIEARPANWLGIDRIISATVEYPVTAEWLQRMALLMGRMSCQRRDIVTFHADYPVGLWTDDVIQVYDSGAVKLPGIGFTGISRYRILGISGIKFEDEYQTIPKRVADYECVRIKDVV